ncbi:hypothetical protein HOLleu_38630 [Holothuria leucospilota]|uniref:IgGFc-binding protein N-terminal domain-containing protein n=1 Tax=Holothuria leucospilota TaxID=206669 RepID=A0A9Q0YEU2_HOLLE|nr:hypothetical protein HOLleu_38630 [Holothuria leucospilota]
MALPGDCSYDTHCQRSRKEKATIVISANETVVVYGNVQCTKAEQNVRLISSAFQIIGIREMGNDYRVISIQNVGHAQIAVVAIENETLVEILYNENTLEDVTIMLQMYETFVTEGMFDITGAYIKSSAPVFVLSGSNGDSIQYESWTPNDAFYECLIPHTQWDTHYYIPPPFNYTSVIVIKIAPWENNNLTVIKWENGIHNSSSGLDSNIYVETSGTLLSIKANKSILVAHFSEPIPHSGESQALSMILLSSPSRFTRNYAIFPVFNLTIGNFAAKHYITVLLPANGETSDLYINNAVAVWKIVGTDMDGNKVFRAILTPGSNLLKNTEPFKVIAVVSAKGQSRSYAFSLR